MERLAQDAETLLNGLGKQWADISTFISKIKGPINDLKQVEIVRQELIRRIQPFGDLINRIITTFKPKTAALHFDLISLADNFDLHGHNNMADAIDVIVKNSENMSLQSMLKELKSFRQYVKEELICSSEESAKLNALKILVASLDNLVNKYSETTIIHKIADTANYFDENGFYCLADVMDSAAEMLVKFSTYIPKMRGDSESMQTETEPVQSPSEGNLSTRYCPDHIGVQAARIAEHIYQCPLDGKIYNYEAGYVNYNGQKVLGGSVAEQTPPNSDFGGIPMRTYDSRQNVINNMY